ncbi:hypothetical protein HPB49_002269 [Dermacentor silvarum]|uniref:Uncharacterized protein n=1 Tax=Dermacentor silvarum TaxID=543639 RepID=A0ACB8C0C4_DERSI|nr:hypothetical protein HPB49_002269 [Dermacentor silvarum]
MPESDFHDLSHILTPRLQSAAVVFGGSVFSTKRQGNVSSQGAVCAECKATRKLLLTKKSRTSRVEVQLSWSRALAQRLKLVKQKAVRRSNHTKSLKSKLSAMAAKNASIREDEFAAKIAGLIHKQREAVQHILKASTPKH